MRFQGNEDIIILICITYVPLLILCGILYFVEMMGALS